MHHSTPRMDRTTNIFIAYAREDKSFLDELRKYLRPLERDKVIKIWYDGEIPPGSPWEDEIKKALHNADIILLLVSANSLDSDYFYDKELEDALERHEAGNAIIIPVILKHCYWKNSLFSQLQVLPKDGKPIVDFTQPSKAYTQIVHGVNDSIQDIERKRNEEIQRKLLAEKKKQEAIEAEKKRKEEEKRKQAEEAEKKRLAEIKKKEQAEKRRKARLKKKEEEAAEKKRRKEEKKKQDEKQAKIRLEKKEKQDIRSEWIAFFALILSSLLCLYGDYLVLIAFTEESVNMLGSIESSPMLIRIVSPITIIIIVFINQAYVWEKVEVFSFRRDFHFLDNKLALFILYFVCGGFMVVSFFALTYGLIFQDLRFVDFLVYFFHLIVNVGSFGFCIFIFLALFFQTIVFLLGKTFKRN